MPLPVSLNVAGRLAVIIGGGRIALRKTRTLLEAGASVRIIAPAIDEEISTLQEATRDRVTCGKRAYSAADLDGAFLVIAATNDTSVNARVVDNARAARIFVIDATSGERGDGIMLATAHIGDVTLAVDSGKSTPAFARRLLNDTRAMLGEAYGRAAKLLAHARTYVYAVTSKERGAAVLRALSELPIEELAAMNPIQVEHRIEELLHPHPAAANIEGTQTVPKTVVCASRGSLLALTQTRTVAAQLAQRGIATRIEQIVTTADRFSESSIAELGTENVFVKELEFQLRDGDADYAVHSCKDLSTAIPNDLHIAAISVREDPRDVFCSERFATFAELPAGARVGTSSPRRTMQLKALRSDLRYEEIRGNVDTRLQKVREGAYDAIVLAMAGLNRLRIRAKHTVPFSIEEIVPAVGQGALAIETRKSDVTLTRELREAINDEAFELAISCERAALHNLRGGCRAPIGIHAFYEEARLVAIGVMEGAGGAVKRARVEGKVTLKGQAERLGHHLAKELEAAEASTAGGPRAVIIEDVFL